MNRKQRFKDETGNVYGLLRVVKYVRTDLSGGAIFECVCKCGNTVEAPGISLRSGNRRSCGCLRNLPRKPKAEFCIICGNEKVYCKNMCYQCYRKQWDEKKREEMERYF